MNYKSQIVSFHRLIVNNHEIDATLNKIESIDQSITSV